MHAAPDAFANAMDGMLRVAVEMEVARRDVAVLGAKVGAMVKLVAENVRRSSAGC